MGEDGVDRYRAPALDKGLDILELLAGIDGGLTQAEIAKRLQRSPNEFYRMLDRLVRRGYVTRLDGDHYSLTLKLFGLAQLHAPVRRLVSYATPLMRELAAGTLPMPKIHGFVVNWYRFALEINTVKADAYNHFLPFLEPFGIASLRGAAFVDVAHLWTEGYDEVIEDRGSGFDVGRTHASTGLGLRLNALGGFVFRYDFGYRFPDGLEWNRREPFQQFFFGWDF